MTFYTYMTRNYLKGAGPKHDLAYDMKLDSAAFPRNAKGNLKDGHRIIEEYLLEHDACSECMDVFEDCWREYVWHERSRRNRYAAASPNPGGMS